MSTELNRETGDYTKPKEQRISVQIGAGMHHFSVWTSEYTASKITRDDWLVIGGRLRDHVAACRQKMAMSGALFLSPDEAIEALKRSTEEAAKQFVYETFKKKQQVAGNLEWQVDSLLSGAEYQI